MAFRLSFSYDKPFLCSLTPKEWVYFSMGWTDIFVSSLSMLLFCKSSSQNYHNFWGATLIKKKIKFSSYIRKFRRDWLQSCIWLTASSYMVKYLRISSYARKAFHIYDFATDPIWISLYMWKISFSFYQFRIRKDSNSASSDTVVGGIWSNVK